MEIGKSNEKKDVFRFHENIHELAHELAHELIHELEKSGNRNANLKFQNE